MKLHLGAGNDIRQGYINHDFIKHRTEIDIAFDLEEKDWYKKIFIEFGDIMCDEIISYDVIEHIADPINFMNCCWELLNENGVLKLKACGWQNPNFWVDITHKKGYDIKSFDYFDPDTELGIEYGYYSNKRWKILEKHYDRRKNIIIEMTPKK